MTVNSGVEGGGDGWDFGGVVGGMAGVVGFDGEGVRWGDVEWQLQYRGFRMVRGVTWALQLGYHVAVSCSRWGYGIVSASFG